MCSDSASPTPPVEGQDYEFDALRRAQGGDPKPPNFVLHRDGKVIGDIAGVPEVMSASPYDGLLDSLVRFAFG